MYLHCTLATSTRWAKVLFCTWTPNICFLTKKITRQVHSSFVLIQIKHSRSVWESEEVLKKFNGSGEQPAKLSSISHLLTSGSSTSSVRPLAPQSPYHQSNTSLAFFTEIIRPRDFRSTLFYVAKKRETKQPDIALHFPICPAPRCGRAFQCHSITVFTCFQTKLRWFRCSPRTVCCWWT